MALSTSIKKFLLLHIAWISVGGIGIIYHALYFWRLWEMRKVGNIFPTVIYIILIAVISISALLGVLVI